MDPLVQNFKLDANVVHNRTEQVSHRGVPPQRIVDIWIKKEKEIGAGTYGKVYLEESDSGEKRAVKEVDGDPSDYTEELHNMVKLSKNEDLFVRLIGWFTSRRYTHIVMEYLHLGDISKCYNEPLSEPEVKDVGKQLLEGLKTMHEMDITHRDIKPQNILVVQKSPIWVKIADFGISKRGSVLKTQIGTPGFMAPEIYFGHSGYANTVDVWSLGCVLYFLLTKRLPFSLGQLFDYYNRRLIFPEDELNARNVSVAGIQFIKGLMEPRPTDRTPVSDALNAPWIEDQSQSTQFLLQKGFDIYAIDFNADMALLLAAAKDDEGHLVRLLLRKGANVAATTHGGWTALHYAADKGHEAAVRLLLEKGADFATKNNYGCTPLHRAAWNGYEAVVQLLLEKGADVAAKTALLWTALHLAADKGHVAVVQLLLEKGADVGAKTALLWTAVHLAADKGHVAVVQLLLEKGADVTAKTALLWTALHVAADKGHTTVVRLLLKKGADVVAKTYDGHTALHRAAENGHEAVVRLLLEWADVRDLSARKWLTSAKLSGAAKNGNEAVVRLLLEQGVEVEAETNDGGTALHRAAGSGHEAVVRLLLEKGADIEAKTYTGWTALHGAARSGHEAVVRLLLEKGANVEAKTYTGWTALHGAARNGHEAVMQLLTPLTPDS